MISWSISSTLVLMSKVRHSSSPNLSLSTHVSSWASTDPQRFFTPLSSAPPAFTPTLYPSNIDHRQMKEILDSELIPVPTVSSPPGLSSSSSSTSSGSPGSELSSSGGFGAVPTFSSTRFDPALGDDGDDPFHSSSASGYYTIDYDPSSFTQHTLNPKMVMAPPPIEVSDDPSESEDEDEMPGPAPSLVKKTKAMRSTQLSPTPKRIKNTKKGRSNRNIKVKAAAKKAQKKRPRSVWLPPPGLPACCAECISAGALEKHRTSEKHFKNFPQDRLTVIKYWCPVGNCQKRCAGFTANDVRSHFIDYSDYTLQPPQRVGYRGSLLPKLAAPSSSRRRTLYQVY